MGKPGSDGALLKRPASQVSSNDGPLLSEAAVAELEATRNINDFRKRARELGLVTEDRNSEGRWRHRSRADILDACRRVLQESRRLNEAAASGTFNEALEQDPRYGSLFVIPRHQKEK